MPYVNELTRVKEEHRAKMTEATEQHRAMITRMQKLHYTQSIQSNEKMMEFISGRDSQTSHLHRDLDTLNKTVLRLVGNHKMEVEHIRRSHHRRLLEVGVHATGHAVAGMVKSGYVIRILN